ncbi:MAG: HEAT repeat domain-containing protein [Gemmataceae bacterium]
MIRLACPRCKTMQQFGDDCAGKTVGCPKCRQPVQVPPVVPVATASPAPMAVPAQPVSYTVPVRREGPDFVMPAGSRMTPLLLVGAGLGVVLFGILFLVTSLPKQKEEVSPATPLEGKNNKKLTYTRSPSEVVKDLKSVDPTERLAAIKELELRGVGGVPALNLLDAIVKDTSKTDNTHMQSRRSAAAAIGKIANLEDEEVRKTQAEVLVSVSGDPDEGVRYAAMEGLGKLGTPGVEPLILMVDRFRVDKRFGMRAGEVLGTMGATARPALPTLQRHMRDAPQIHDRVRFASYIVQIDPNGPGVAPILGQALKYNVEGVRRHALVLGGKMGNGARGLANQLSYVASNDINAELRQMAQTALEKMNLN